MPRKKSKLTDRWYFYCEPCGYKKITDGKESKLVEIKTSPIPLGIPTKDPSKYIKKEVKEKDSSGKVTTRTFWQPKSQEQNKKVKCPKCGRGITAKHLGKAYVTAFEEADKREQTKQKVEDKKNRILDGLPKKRRTEFEKQFEKMVGKYLPTQQATQSNLDEFNKVIDSLMQGRKEIEDKKEESDDPRH